MGKERKSDVAVELRSEEGLPLFGLDLSYEEMCNGTRRRVVKLKTCIIYVSIMSLAFAHHYKTATIRSEQFKGFIFNIIMLCALYEKR
jgi:hypothetical protein